MLGLITLNCLRQAVDLNLPQWHLSLSHKNKSAIQKETPGSSKKFAKYFDSL